MCFSIYYYTRRRIMFNKAKKCILLLSVLVMTITLVGSGLSEGDIPREYKAALKRADMYANKMHMSKAAVYEQLISEYGEKFTEDAAKYAIENVKADWKENALYNADMCANKMHMSKVAVYEQLISEYG